MDDSRMAMSESRIWTRQVVTTPCSLTRSGALCADARDGADSTSSPAALCLQPGDAASLGEIAHAKNIALPLGHRDNPARVKEVENMRRLDALIVGWKRHHMARALVSAGEERAA